MKNIILLFINKLTTFSSTASNTKQVKADSGESLNKTDWAKFIKLCHEQIENNPENNRLFRNFLKQNE